MSVGELKRYSMVQTTPTVGEISEDEKRFYEDLQSRGVNTSSSKFSKPPPKAGMFVLINYSFNYIQRQRETRSVESCT